MSTTPVQQMVDRLRHAASFDDASDGDLLDAYLSARNDSAFGELVRRHGPMVWGVCTRILTRREDAEDAYQATFLVLVRKAAAIRPRARVGAWLYGVAYHVALKARNLACKRGAMEQQMQTLPEPAERLKAADELASLLDRELTALPEKYRVPIVLCELEGRTMKDVARDLGCPIGTLAGRLSRGRDLLARRLTKRGVPIAAAALTTLLAEHAKAAAPALTLTQPSATALALADAAVRALSLAKLKGMLTAAALLVLLVFGGWALHASATGTDAPNDPTNVDALQLVQKAAAPPPQEPEAFVAWGEPVDGVQFGIAFKGDRNSHHIGDTATLVFKVRNISAEPKTFEQEYFSWYHDHGWPTVTDADGNKISFTPSESVRRPSVADRTIKLAPKEVITFEEMPYIVGDNSKNVPRFRIANPGTYRIRFESLSNRQGRKRPTGTLELVVLDRCAWGKAVDGVEYGVEFKAIQNSYRVGDEVAFVIKARNISAKPVSIEQAAIWTFDAGGGTLILPNVVDGKGKQAKAFGDRVPDIFIGAQVRTIHIAPKETVILGAPVYRIGVENILHVAGIDATPGTYRVKFDTVCCLPRHKRPTGTLEMIVTEPIAWGKEVNGAQYGLSISSPKSRYAQGEKIEFVFHARNMTPKPLKLPPFGLHYAVNGETWPVDVGFVPAFTDAKGNTIRGIWNTNKWPEDEIDHRLPVDAAKTVTLGGISWHVNTQHLRNVELPPGKYSVHFEQIMKGVYTQTGKLSLEIVAAARKDEAKIEPGKPVAGVEHWIEFKEPRSTYHLGETITLVVKARNPTLDATSFDLAVVTEFGPLPKVTDANEQAVKVKEREMLSPLWFPERRVRLGGRQTVILGEVEYVLGRPDHNAAWLDVVPGKYRIRFDSVARERDARPTGSLELIALQAEPKRKASVLELFEKIQIGMSREQVEMVLGKPIFRPLQQPDELQANYLGDEYRERNLENFESPYAPGGMYVSYVNGKLTKKNYNPQWLKIAAWGKAVDGVEYGLELKSRQRICRVGEQVTFILKARNTTDKAVALEQVEITGTVSAAKGAIGAATPSVADAKGKAVKAWPLNLPGQPADAKVSKIQIAAKESVTLGQVSYTIGAGVNRPCIEASPGLLWVSFDTVCWLPGHRRPTGALEIIVAPKE